MGQKDKQGKLREKAKDMEDRVIISLYIIGVSEGKKKQMR